MLNLDIERLRHLPQRADESWQVETFKAPVWKDLDDGRRVRPMAAMCVSTRTGQAAVTEATNLTPPVSRILLESIRELATAKHSSYRPSRLEVSKPEFAAELRPLLARAGIEVVERPELPELTKVRSTLVSDYLRRIGERAALGEKRVSVDQIRAFAEAAREFHQADLWRYLSGSDLIEVIAPTPEYGFAFASLERIGPDDFGVTFYESRAQHRSVVDVLVPTGRMRSLRCWMLWFVPIDDIPNSDADLWEDYRLPLAGDSGYPYLAKLTPDGRYRRPSPRQWMFVEGLLRALARSSEAEIDTGCWTKSVERLDETVEYTLSLPDLLDPPPEDDRAALLAAAPAQFLEKAKVHMHRALRKLHSASFEEMQAQVETNFSRVDFPIQPAETPLEQAQDLLFEAHAARGRRRILLARRALEIYPDCADAYVLLAENEREIQRARELYEKGVAAGERCLDRDAIQQRTEDMWPWLEARPYLRALYGLARCLDDTEDRPAAIPRYLELLRYNPEDNQDARYRLGTCLLVKSGSTS